MVVGDKKSRVTKPIPDGYVKIREYINYAYDCNENNDYVGELVSLGAAKAILEKTIEDIRFYRNERKH